MPGKPHPARDRVRILWEGAFGSPPPPYLSVGLMERALAHESQCKQYGGLPAAARNALLRIAEGAPVGHVSNTRLRPGAHLFREWNGRTYQIEVLSDGYRMDGRTWASLSAIAKHITGTSWSGPRFFGLTNQRSNSP
ncbi:MAG: DUF2924 domain-containing protein [Silicimonas sp.]|nr:DUF2924 domain-containing protein [Silicimonas sp.]